MELRVLQYFLAVAREQSISRAAQSLHLTQPTLSRQLKDLEEELGKQLLIRGKRNKGITLTEEGMLLRKRAEEIVDLINKTEKEVMCSDESISGDIYIGAAETDALRVIAKVAHRIQTEYPGIHFHIVSGDSVDILERIDKGLFDFGVLLGSRDPSKYEYLALPMRDRWGVLMRKDSELAQKDAIGPEDLWDKPLIVSRQSIVTDYLSQWMGREPQRLNIVATYNLIYNASLMVEEGMGYGLTLDRLINTTGESLLCFRPFAPEYTIGMSILWKRYQILSKPAELLITQLQQYLAEKAAE